MKFVLGWTYDLMWNLRFVGGTFVDACGDLIDDIRERSDDE